LAGIVAWIDEPDITMNAALELLNVTPVAPVKFAPLIATAVPTDPLDGEKPLTDGNGAAGGAED
jgi:hypothetical protein